jgi:uncharacterized protein
MENVIIRSATEQDFPEIVELNASEVEYTSVMDEERLRHLHSLSAYHKVAVVDGKIAAFILVMKDGVPYRNDNYEWHTARYQQFLYIDRIVVDQKYQGQKIGSLLYKDLFDYARKHNIPLVCCEINAIPPNKPSQDFHARHGFRETGSQWICNGKKKVSMQVAKLEE